MRRPTPPPVIQSVHMGAPMGGLNALDSASAMPALDAVALWNLVAAEYGLRSRLGWREWCTGLTGLTDNLVRTVLPFAGGATAGAGDKLFVTTSTGIWDVSASTATPSQVLAFGTQTGDAGRGVCTVAVTSGGHFLLYADAENGLHAYSEASDTWAAIAMGGAGTEISGVDPADICFVTTWKSRVWMVEKATAKAWYLAAGSIYGAATGLNFAGRFRAGGALRGLWSWTYDGGAGLDDSLVAVSDGGDVAVYQGTDPSSASTFGLKGTWYVGALPEGRNIATDFGGDLLLLSRTGVVSMSKLVTGGDVDRSQYVTNKVANLFNAAMLSKASLTGWSMRMHPEDNTLLVTVPTYADTATEQLAMSLATRGWSRYRDLPIYSCEAWEGKMYFGTVDGRVCVNDGYVDGVLLSDPSANTPVQWAALTSFQNLGNANMKQVQSLRPVILCEATAPAYEVGARYDFDFSELATVSAANTSGSTWDNAVWDVDAWAGEYQPSQQLRGAVGMGRAVAVIIRGIALARTVWVGTDVLFTQGGFL